jgi:LmbE family N-acetylglucosaminyl deacetylase
MHESLKKKHILAMGAHSDDIEYGCGGTLLRYKDLGHSIYLYVLTDGSKTASVEIRHAEQEEAAKYLGASGLYWGGFKDAELPDELEIIRSMEEVVKHVCPDEVYINYHEDTHQDHRKLATAALVATRSVRKVFYYESWSSLNFNPNVFVDIENVIARKKELLCKHMSQVTREFEHNQNRYEDAVEAAARFRGFQARIHYAEAFLPVRFIRDLK